MSFCLVDSKATLSNSAASNNPPLESYGMLGSAASSSPLSSSSSSSVTSSPSSQITRSSQDQRIVEGAPVASRVSTEEQSMSKPTDTTISHGVISVIGRRRSMEDAVTVAPALVHLTKPHPAGKEKEQAQLMTYDFFAVYDGHGVQRISQRCKERLHHVVAEEFLVAGGVDNWDNVMTTSFARMDDEMAKECGVNPAATVVRPTALVVMVGKDQIVVANCGDSRAVLCTDGVALPLSNDHKPGRPDNKQRLEAADDGDLKPYVISSPEVTVHKRTISDDFMVIASDGLWDMVSNETACDIVRKCCSDEVVSSRLLDGVIGNCAAASAAMLVELALARGSKDNISVIVVELQPLHARGGSSST